MVGATGSFNSGGRGGTNEAESQPTRTTDTARIAAITAAPAVIPCTGQINVLVVLKIMVLMLFSRDRWDRPGGREDLAYTLERIAYTGRFWVRANDPLRDAR